MVTFHIGEKKEFMLDITMNSNISVNLKPQTSLIMCYYIKQNCTVPYPDVDKVKVKVNIWTQSQHKASPR